MRGYFDNEEPEDEEPEEHRHDTEVTLSTGAQLGIVFCLLLLCGLCFGLGYWVGHRGTPAAPATAANQPAAPTAAPDQEPLQGNGTLPKPSADAQVPPTPTPDESSGTPPAPTSDTSPAPTQPQPTSAATAPPHAPTSSPAPAPTAPKPAAPASAPRSAPVQPPAPTRTYEPPSEQPAPAMRPAYPSETSEYMVQIAAVSHSEDAYVLVNALRNHGFAATAQHMPDGLIHVRIGPFATHEEASRMSARLLGDGYNAMVQP
jgi:DedD protein